MINKNAKRVEMKESKWGKIWKKLEKNENFEIKVSKRQKSGNRIRGNQLR